MADAQTPEWWVDRLYRRLTDRQIVVEHFDAYYRGDHPLPWLPRQAESEFRRILKMSRTNYMGLVVDAKAERIQVEGFRVDNLSETADADLWRIWQANNLDSDSDQAWLEALIGGSSYILVAPNQADRRTPLVTVEHASQAIVEFVPGSGRRQVAAGLKVWVDDWNGLLMATLYLPSLIYKFQAKAPESGLGTNPTWLPRVGFEESETNPLGAVPLVELANNPRMLTGGRSLLSDLTDIQDRINKTVVDRLMTQDYGAFPQKWATAYPEETPSGDPVPPIDIGRDRMVTTDVVGATFGQWDAAPLDPYSAAKREDVKDIASRSRTPAQDLLGEMANVNGETLKASQSGHVAVVRQMCRNFADDLERAQRLIQVAAGLPVSESIETIWANPEYRTEGELTDAVMKRLPLTGKRQAREDLRYSQVQIARMEADAQLEAATSGLGDLTALYGPKPDGS